uniref:CCHC-type domain-containing protein n=1 Tax=Solanum lycopersicum TaxID=4081 RepID=A0A3Q7I5B9_SOLLC
MTKGSLSIMEYVQQKRTFANNLVMALQHVANYELMTYILYGLDPFYGPFCTITTSELLLGLARKFLVFSDEKNKNLMMNHVTLSANVANRQSFQSRPSYNSSPITNQSQQRNPNRNDNRRPSNRPICQICEKLGHLAKNCYD